MRLLLVEDDMLLADGIVSAMQIAGYVADHVSTGEHAIHALESEQFDLVILDLGLPKMSGHEVLKHIRGKKIQTPVLILSARDAIEEKVAGLDAGADDYLMKPFNLDELKARIRALLRRHSGERSPTINIGDLEIDPARHQVRVKGEDCGLTPKEFAILMELCTHKNRVLSKEQLEPLIYGWDGDVDSNSIVVHMHNLRKKIDLPLIKTIRGIGYMLETP
jgi:two-component system response regulator QseB